jgi:hypothetical protein
VGQLRGDGKTVGSKRNKSVQECKQYVNDDRVPAPTVNVHGVELVTMAAFSRNDFASAIGGQMLANED